MTIYQRFGILSHAMVLVGIATFALAARDALVLVLSGPLVLVSWQLFRTTTRSPVPRWVTYVLLGAATLLMLRALTGELSDVISVVGHYLVWLQIIKLFENRSPRDQAQLLTLSLMLTIGSVLTSVTFEVGMMLLLYVPVALSTIVHFQLFAGTMRVADDTGRAERRGDDLPPPARVTRRGRGHLRGVLAASCVGIVGLGAVVFLIMPRDIGEGIFGEMQQPHARSTTGINDHVTLGQSGTITESKEIVLEAELWTHTPESGLRVPYLPERRHLLRGAILDEYSVRGATWRRGNMTRLPDYTPEVNPKHVDSRFPVPESMTQHQWIELRILGWVRPTKHLLTLWRPRELAIPGRPDRLHESTIDSEVTTDFRRREPIDYAVLCGVQPRDRVGVEIFSGYAFPLDRGGPGIREELRYVDPFRYPERIGEAGSEGEHADREWIEAKRAEFAAIKAHALEILTSQGIGEDATAREKSDAFERFLEVEYAYSLDQVAPRPGEDPIAAFLFRSKRGHCEYFASAMVALCRAVGIESRMVTGFVATEYDERTERYTVRRSHAHAWAEVRVEAPPTTSRQHIWESYDPSPQASLELLHRPPTGVLASLRDVLDSAETAWIRGVISFDRSKQSRVFQADSGGPFGIYRMIADRAERMRERSAGRTPLQVALDAAITFLTSFVVLTGVMLGLWFLWRTLVRIMGGGPRRRRVELEGPDARLRERQTTFFRRMHRLLRRAGHERPEGTPSLRHADAIAARDDEAARITRRLTELYYRARFGHAVLTSGELDDVESLLDALGARLAAIGAGPAR